MNRSNNALAEIKRALPSSDVAVVPASPLPGPPQAVGSDDADGDFNWLQIGLLDALESGERRGNQLGLSAVARAAGL